MKRSVREAFTSFSSDLEGVVPWLYLDVKGLVTTAIGNLVDPLMYAVTLPWVRPTGEPATREEIVAAWNAVKNRPELARLGFRVAGQYTTIRLTPLGVQEVVMSKLAQMEKYLQKRFPEFESWPADAQLATLSMAWACGPAFRFATLEQALKDKDFATAAASCQINATGNPGVIPRNKANAQLYRNAAQVQTGMFDPDALYWPRDLVSEQDTQPELPNPPSEPTRVTSAADLPTILPQPAELIEGAIAEYRRERDEEG